VWNCLSIRGDLIEVFKIVKGFVNIDRNISLLSNTAVSAV